jgi:hypothetical protein
MLTRPYLYEQPNPPCELLCGDAIMAIRETHLCEATLGWNLFGKPKCPSDSEMQSFAELISKPLELQLGLAAKMLTAGRSNDPSLINPNPRALGYVYGWSDAFLRVRGWDMANTSVGVPVLFQVFRRLWPGQEGQLINFVTDHLRDSSMMAGMMHGGQQYLDWKNQKLSPTGLTQSVIS